MPSVSDKQSRFMRMCSHPEGREWAKNHGVKCPPVKVAKEFAKADKKKKKRLKDYL